MGPNRVGRCTSNHFRRLRSHGLLGQSDLYNSTNFTATRDRIGINHEKKENHKIRPCAESSGDSLQEASTLEPRMKRVEQSNPRPRY
jgi:hypothetical protein